MIYTIKYIYIIYIWCPLTLNRERAAERLAGVHVDTVLIHVEYGTFFLIPFFSSHFIFSPH